MCNVIRKLTESIERIPKGANFRRQAFRSDAVIEVGHADSGRGLCDAIDRPQLVAGHLESDADCKHKRNELDAEDIAYSADRMNQLPLERIVHLGAQAPDVNIDDVRVAVEIHV